MVGVRLPNRREIIRGPIFDIFPIENAAESQYVALIEVKAGPCEVNRVLSNPGSDALNRVLLAMGVIDEDMIDDACESIWGSGVFEDDELIIAHVCLGREINQGILEKYPKVPQITWEDALGFIFDRFGQYRGPKADHSQWDVYGQFLWVAAARINERALFADFMKNSMIITASA